LAYKGAGLRFGREYLIPKPFDPRLIEIVAPAVAKAAAESGVATRPIADMEAYRQKLSRFVYHSGNAMQPVFAAARTWLRSVIFAEGEDERVLRAASQTRTSRSPYCLADRRRSRRGSSNLGFVFRPARPATSSIRKMPRSTRARRPLTMRERSATAFPRRSRSRRCEAKARCLRLRCLRQASATRCSAELSGRPPNISPPCET